MMDDNNVQMATQAGGTAFLQQVLQMQVVYAAKSQDINLYDFGFGVSMYRSEPSDFVLHIECAFDIYWDNETVHRFYEDTGEQEFEPTGKRLLGQHVREIRILEGNQMMIELENCKIIVRTENDGIESWRFFNYRTDGVHLVAADEWLEFN